MLEKYIMKTFFLTIITSASLLLTPAFAYAENKTEMYKHGEEAHTDHCNKCHTDSVYTRKNRFVKSMSALSKQVKRCKDSNGIAWFEEDTEAVAHFINEKYYKF